MTTSTTTHDAKATFLIFTKSGVTATEHSAHKAVVEPSGALSFYEIVADGSCVLTLAFANNSWDTVKKM